MNFQDLYGAVAEASFAKGEVSPGNTEAIALEEAGQNL